MLDQTMQRFIISNISLNESFVFFRTTNLNGLDFVSDFDLH